MCIEIVGRVLAVDERSGEVTLETARGARRASVALMLFEGTSVGPGEWVSVHAGFALRKLDEPAALALMREQATIHASLMEASE